MITLRFLGVVIFFFHCSFFMFGVLKIIKTKLIVIGVIYNLLNSHVINIIYIYVFPLKCQFFNLNLRLLENIVCNLDLN